MYNIEQKLKKISKELSVSDYKFEKLEKSYRAVGNYLGNSLKVDIRVFPQGSFSYGTAIKPISDSDDYDIDLVCVIDKKIESPKVLKNLVGDALKNSSTYSKLLDKEEGKRCWTLKYSENDNYHLDILPALESETYVDNKLLNITHQEDGVYESMFRKTAPEAYKEWFDEIQKNELTKLKKSYSTNFECDLSEVPYYKVKTNLQMAIQLVKRYRDIKYEKDSDNKPISIIISTVIAKLYEDNDSIIELIRKFSKNWSKCFLINDDVYVLKNPVNDKEEFTDKWEKEPNKKEEFIFFMSILEKDIDELLNINDNIKESEILKKFFGQNIVNAVYKEIGENYLSQRKSKGMYVDDDGYINFQKNGTLIKEHNFYGK